MMRYLPANGTAGLARCADSTLSRSPCPPARITAATVRMNLGQVRGRRHAREALVDLAAKASDDVRRPLARGATEQLLAVAVVDSRVGERICDHLERSSFWLPGEDGAVDLYRSTRHVDEQAVGVVIAAEAVDESNLIAQVGLRRRHQPQTTRSGQADPTEPFGVYVR